jgi:hypothetical protein
MFGADSAPSAAGHVEVVWRVLPLEDRDDRGGPLHGLCGVDGRGLLEVAAPQRRGGVDGLRQRRSLGALDAAAEPGVGEGDGAAQAHGENFADQLGGPASGNGRVANPAPDGGVVVQEHEAVPRAGLVHAGREAVV